MTNIFSKIRFLPLTIFAATLMLTVRVGDIWEGLDGLLDGAVSVATASAQQKTGDQSATETPPPGVTGLESVEEPAQSSTVSGMLSDDPTLLTQTEIDLLQQLAERREALETRERDLDIRIEMLNAAESRIDKKVDELKAFQASISKLIRTYGDQQDTKMQSLVKIYESMKPKEAARIFEALEIDILLMVAERMKERKLAPIMAKMDPARATEITIELAKLRELPKPWEDTGG